MGVALQGEEWKIVKDCTGSRAVPMIGYGLTAASAERNGLFALNYYLRKNFKEFCSDSLEGQSYYITADGTRKEG